MNSTGQKNIDYHYLMMKKKRSSHAILLNCLISTKNSREKEPTLTQPYNIKNTSYEEKVPPSPFT